MFIKSFVILGTLAASYYAAFYYFQNFFVRAHSSPLLRPREGRHCSTRWLIALASPQAALFCAMIMGAMKAEVGVSIQHDANHGAPTAASNSTFPLILLRTASRAQRTRPR